MEAAGAQPLEPYPGADARWRCRCLTCGEEITPCLKTVRRGIRACRFCSAAKRGAARRSDPEKAAQVMRDAGLEPLEPYPGFNKAAWRCRCLTCGAVVSPRYNTIQQGGRGCWTCGKVRGRRAMRLPEDIARALMIRAGAIPLENYPGSDQPWRSRCITCSREITPTLHNVRSGSNPCVYCSGQRVDVDEACVIMEAAGVRPLVDFPGSDVGWKSKCLRCGRIVSPRYSAIKAGQGGCKYCAGRAVDLEAAKALMRRASVEPQGPWPGRADQPWECRCTNCARTVYPAYNNVRRGHAACGYCAGLIVDPELALQVMQAAELEPLTPYPGGKEPWPSRCLKCGQLVTPTYTGIRIGRGGCRSCVKYGFDPAMPADVYLVTSTTHEAIKIGISNHPDNRLDEHRRAGWLLAEVEGAPCRWTAVTGAVAEAAEKEILKWWRDVLAAPPAVSRDQMPQRGASETAPLNLVDLHETARRVAATIGILA